MFVISEFLTAVQYFSGNTEQRHFGRSKGWTVKAWKSSNDSQFASCILFVAQRRVHIHMKIIYIFTDIRLVTLIL